jgi:hypothetical protein
VVKDFCRDALPAPDNGDNFNRVALLHLSLGPKLPVENLSVVFHGNQARI